MQDRNLSVIKMVFRIGTWTEIQNLDGKLDEKDKERNCDNKRKF